MRSFLAFIFALVAVSGASPINATTPGDRTISDEKLAPVHNVSKAQAMQVLDKIDELVRKEFFDEVKTKSDWTQALEAAKEKLPAKKISYAQLSATANVLLASLHSSHCQFVTNEDEAFYFLHSLFNTLHARRKDHLAQKIYGPGLATGGPGFAANAVRYVLDGGAADKAAIEVGDVIVRVDGQPYRDYLQLLRPGVSLDLLKQGKTPAVVEIKMQPRELYPAYVDAIKASARVIQSNNHKIGYIHLWSGGSPAAEAMNEIISDKMREVDGLILDLRDGYGGASPTDLDVFFRPANAYPDLISKNRAGKEFGERLYFDKPLVLLINSGSRSGKELLAWSLKNSHRARLVGETTAGAVVAGSLFNINDEMSLYLAVADVQLSYEKQKTQAETGPLGQKSAMQKERIEGVGVAPDMAILNESHNQNGYGLQLKGAFEALEKLIAGQN
jgi:carboxyl-terminal processing protease